MIVILNNITWDKLLDVYKTFGETLNANNMKFVKGTIYELFCVLSDENIKYVNKDGYDCLYKNKIKIEIKFTQNMLLTKKNKEIKNIISFRFKNSRGNNKIILDETNTADIYILIQREAIGYVLKNDVITHLKGQKDLDAKIPNKFIKMLYKYDNNINEIDFDIINISKIQYNMLNNILYSIWHELDIKKELKECLYKIADNL